ncbi:MAG: DUF3667 domain-containing protein [Chitinophagaceae bacterium]|nr:DUF3667 domain-containing protein [Chitinophagaceae bacterium]
MSHIPQRKEKDCLNCGTVVQGRYCHECGQENVVPKETFWHMLTHFFNDITHFDGSFFTTAKDLLFKPGFLSKEYVSGKRVKYLHPVRMYVFTSAIFFLLFFGFFSGSKSINLDSNADISGKERLKVIEKLEKEFANDDSKKDILLRLEVLKDTTQAILVADFPILFKDLSVLNITGEGNKYHSVNEYDSIQKTLPTAKKDGWFRSRIIRKEISLNKDFGSDPSAAAKKLGNSFLHKLPYLLFVSLPLFALILRLVYIRRKQFYFADHGIFTIHLYIFTFIVLLAVFSLNSLESITHLGVINYLIGALFILLTIYLYKAMRYFYGQSRLKTLIKLFLVFILSLLLMFSLFVFFFLFSAFTL